MKRSTIFSLVAALLCTTSAFAIGEARVTGVVRDSQGNSIPDVDITVKATEKMTFEKQFETNEEGKYAIFLLDGTIRYEFIFSKEGYVSRQEVWKLELVPTKNEKDITLLKTSEAEPGQPGKPVNPAHDIYNEGVILANAGNDEEAIAKLEEAVALDAELSAGWVALARLYGRTKQWKDAVRAGERALELVGEDSAIATILAEAYSSLGDEASAKKYRELAPANPAALFNEAVPHLNANRDAEAEKLLKRAVAADDTFAKAHYELGALYARMGKNDDARKHLTRYLELEPEGESATFAREMIKYLE